MNENTRIILKVEQGRHQNDVTGIILASLTLTLNRFHKLFWCFCSLFWKSNYSSYSSYEFNQQQWLEIKITHTIQSIFFSIWHFFCEHWWFTGQQGKREAICTPLYHFTPLHRHLDISWVITAESSPLCIPSSGTCRGELSAVIVWLTSKCLWSRWKW